MSNTEAKHRTPGLRYAAHLGFPSIDHPLLAGITGSDDPVRHIEFAAGLGLAGVLDPFAASRSSAAQARIGMAAMDHDLAMGSFLYVPFPELARARWASPDLECVPILLDDVCNAIAIAARLGSRHIVILAIAEVGIPASVQQSVMADRLKWAGDLAARAGMTVLVEGVSRARLPHLLLHGIAASATVVSAAAHPAVRLAFDTGVLSPPSAFSTLDGILFQGQRSCMEARVVRHQFPR